jgi:hypothetical protein
MSKTESDPASSPFRKLQPARRFQFGMGTLLISMVLFAVASLSLQFVARLPLVTNEIHAWMGSVPSKNMDGSDRFTQLLFLLFCYSTPLLTAAVLYWLSVGVDTWTKRGSLSAAKPEDEFKME